jgi:hypothetical protein
VELSDAICPDRSGSNPIGRGGFVKGFIIYPYFSFSGRSQHTTSIWQRRVLRGKDQFVEKCRIPQSGVTCLCGRRQVFRIERREEYGASSSGQHDVHDTTFQRAMRLREAAANVARTCRSLFVPRDRSSGKSPADDICCGKLNVCFQIEAFLNLLNLHSESINDYIVQRQTSWHCISQGPWE